MQIYRSANTLQGHSYLHMVGIDPGVSSGGFAHIDLCKDTLATYQYHPTKDRKILQQSFPNLYNNLQEVVDEYVQKIGSFINHEHARTLYAIEYPFLSGSFSVGLISYLALLTQGLIKLNPACIYLVPTRLGNMYLQKKSVNNSEVVKYVKEMFPSVKKRISSHEADALLVLYTVARPWFESKGITLRDTSNIITFEDGRLYGF